VSQSVLVLAPHADDEVLGCSSWLGGSSHVVYMGIDPFHVVPREERLAEVTRVSELCAFSWEAKDFPVNRYHLHLFDQIQELEALLDRMEPETLLVPAPTHNQDHRTVYEAAVTAVRQHDRNFFVPRVLLYEGPDSYLAQAWQLLPTYFRRVDLDRKLEANALHASQRRGHRSEDILRTMAAHRGAQSGLGYAEGFVVHRWVDNGTAAVL
jgi:N-acetylglucosamine malate deacetylase 1